MSPDKKHWDVDGKDPDHEYEYGVCVIVEIIVDPRSLFLH